MKTRVVLVSMGLSMLLAASLALAQNIKKTPLPSSHPLIGTWKIDVPGTRCAEFYEVRADGTARVMSGQEIAESEFEMSLQPSKKGFYKWVDKIVKDNQKPDCSGEVMKLGDVATNFIALNKTGDKFLMCEQEDADTCVGPFVRQPGI